MTTLPNKTENWFAQTFFRNTATSISTVVQLLLIIAALVSFCAGAISIASDAGVDKNTILSVYLFFSFGCLISLIAVTKMVVFAVWVNRPKEHSRLHEESKNYLESARIQHACLDRLLDNVRQDPAVDSKDQDLENILGRKLEPYLKTRLTSSGSFSFTVKRIIEGDPTNHLDPTVETFFRDNGQNKRDHTNECVEKHYVFEWFRGQHHKTNGLDCLIVHDITLLTEHFQEFKDRAHDRGYAATLAFPLVGSVQSSEPSLDIETSDVYGFFCIDSPNKNIFRGLFDVINGDDHLATNCGEDHTFREDKHLFLGICAFVNTLVVLETAAPKE